MMTDQRSNTTRGKGLTPEEVRSHARMVRVQARMLDGGDEMEPTTAATQYRGWAAILDRAAAQIECLHTDLAHLTAERDALKVENERLTSTLRNADRLDDKADAASWMVQCADARAELSALMQTLEKSEARCEQLDEHIEAMVRVACHECADKLSALLPAETEADTPQVVCGECHGTGGIPCGPIQEGRIERCDKCDGFGHVDGNPASLPQTETNK